MQNLLSIIIIAFTICLATANVVVVTNDNQNAFWDFSKYKPHLAVFHIDYNPYCAEFLANLTEISKHFPKVTIFTIKCNDGNAVACDGLDMENLPHVEFYNHGTIKNHDGRISTQKVISWLKHLHEEPHFRVETVRHFEDMKDVVKREFAAMVYKGAMGAREMKLVKRLAFSHREKVKTYIVEDSAIADQLGLKDQPEGLYLIRDAKKNLIPLNILSKSKFEKDFYKYRFRPLALLNRRRWNSITEMSDQYSLVLFDTGCHYLEKRLLRHVFTFIKYHSIDFLQISRKKGKRLYYEVKRQLGAQNVCSFVVAKRTGKYAWTKFYFSGHFRLKAILEVLDKLISNELPRYYRSKPNRATDTHELNSYSLTTALDMLQKPLFVLFYDAGAAGTETVNKFLEVMRSLPHDIGFAMKTFDLDLNDVKDFEVDDSPLIMWFNPKSVSVPIKFQGEISVENMEAISKLMLVS